MAYKDTEACKAAKHRHYLANKDKYIQRQRDSRHLKRQWLEEYKKSLACETCGENHPAVLDFHHNDNTAKDRGVADAIRFWSLKHVMEEIQKCQVLCSNCHRKLHWDQD